MGGGQDDDGDTVETGGFDDGFRPSRRKQRAVRQDGVRVENHLGGAGHDGEDGRVRDQDHRDPGRRQGFREGLVGQHIVVLGAVLAAGQEGVRLVVVVRVGFGVYDGELAFRGGTKEESLDSDGGGVGEDGLVGVDLFEGRRGDLVVGPADLVDDLFDALDDFLPEVRQGPGHAHSGRDVATALNRGLDA